MDTVKNESRRRPKWLVTGCAGFIGSNLLESLLKLGQTVVGLDNFATGYQRNLDEVRGSVTPEQGPLHLHRRRHPRPEACRRAVQGVDFVLHQAALGSVPRSLNDPITTNEVNIGGFLNMLVAARDAEVKSFVYAASSSTYGDHPALPKVEENIGNWLSPYAVTKYVNELYADVFARSYGFEAVGLRYFNVFGKRQDPDGAYAAVIPKWTAAMIQGKDVTINGDGETSRDFWVSWTTRCRPTSWPPWRRAEGRKPGLQRGGQRPQHAEPACLTSRRRPCNQGVAYAKKPVYADFRAGDVRHSQADVSKAGLLGITRPRYTPGPGSGYALRTQFLR